MSNLTYDAAITFVQTHGYALIFLVMVVEGPIITTAAAFAASLGYFNVYWILVLAILGDIVGDSIYYGFGYYGGAPFIAKYGRRFGFTLTMRAKLEHRITTNLGKTLFVLKNTPLAGIGIPFIGSLRVSFWNFLRMSLVITIPRAILLVSLGFFFGWAAKTALTYFAWGEYALVFLVLFVIVFALVFKHASRRLREQL